MGAIKTLARLSGMDPIYGDWEEAGFQKEQRPTRHQELSVHSAIAAPLPRVL